MRQKFTTTLDSNLLQCLKIISTIEKKDINVILEELILNYVAENDHINLLIK
jgi:hypothetical protein